MWRISDRGHQPSTDETDREENVRKRIRQAATGLVAVALIFSALLVPLSAAAASGTAVYLVNQGGPTTSGGQTTFDVVIKGADEGVGALDITVDVADARVGSITHVKQHANPKIGGAKIAADGSSATIRAALMESVESDSIRVASITLDADRVGRTELSLTVSVVGDHNGTAYAVSDVSGATFVVENRSSDDDDDDDNDAVNVVTTSVPADDANEGVTAPSPTTAVGDGAEDEAAKDDGANSSKAATTTAASAATGSDDRTTVGMKIPGFTLLLTILALLTAGLVAARRR